MAKKVLIVEDETNIAELLHLYLEKEGFDTAVAGDGGKGVELFRSFHPDLVLLDIMLPIMDGWSVLKKIRESDKTPVIMLTAKDDVSDKVMGLDMGADDYITKPFGIGELRARVAAHLRRENRKKKNAVFVGEIQLELRSRKIFYKGEEIPLTKSEYAICEYLAMNKGQVFSKERIYEHVFGFDGESDLSAITEHIKNIRAKFQKQGLLVIETKWGIGYRWE